MCHRRYYHAWGNYIGIRMVVSAVVAISIALAWLYLRLKEYQASKFGSKVLLR
jgi:hypothetical protein